STLTALFNVRDNMARAARRCPIIAARRAYGQMVADIGKQSDFAFRVTSIDYAAGTLKLDAGTMDGVQVSTPEHPFQFEVCVGDESLPVHEQGLSADYYTAVVTETDAHTCTCQLRHRWRTVEKTEETDEEEADPDALKHLPDPITGVVSARAWLPNPRLDADLTVAEDADYTDFIASLVGARQNSPEYVFLRTWVRQRPRFVYFDEYPRRGFLRLHEPYLYRGILRVAPVYNWEAAARYHNGIRERYARLYMPGSDKMARVQSERKNGHRPSAEALAPVHANITYQKKSIAALKLDQELETRRQAARSQAHVASDSQRTGPAGSGRGPRNTATGESNPPKRSTTVTSPGVGHPPIRKSDGGASNGTTGGGHPPTRPDDKGKVNSHSDVGHPPIREKGSDPSGKEPKKKTDPGDDKKPDDKTKKKS
ncbi:MAG TPA: hypothetical protein VKT77_16520, partial [Chthonomonadaceae bacterium]|nr:hypothetical protein [Chthonomonadaceae bacterium]